MQAGIAANGDIKIRHISVAQAVVEVVTKSEREIDAETFFNAIPPAERGTAFYACLKTLISKAEKLLGAKRVNELARLKQTHRIEFKEGAQQ